MKACTKCGEYKPLEDYHKDKSKKDGVHSHCKSCHSARIKEKRKTDQEFVSKCRERSKKYRRENPEKFKKSCRNATLMKKYGIGIDEFNDLLEKQGGGCAICCSSHTGVSWSNNLHVDHCHETGKIRGLLCQPCNVSLGKMKESPKLLRKAAKYLEQTGG